MKRLIEKGLMFGNLFHVGSQALVERYGRALLHLTGKSTSLREFHIDISGYSPEIGDELEDHYYLNHGGVNRQFILLTVEQKYCPLLNAQFSTNRDILRRFIDANEQQLLLSRPPMLWRESWKTRYWASMCLSSCLIFAALLSKPTRLRGPSQKRHA